MLIPIVFTLLGNKFKFRKFTGCCMGFWDLCDFSWFVVTSEKTLSLNMVSSSSTVRSFKVLSSLFSLWWDPRSPPRQSEIYRFFGSHSLHEYEPMDASLLCPEALIVRRTSMPASSRAVIAVAYTEWLVYTADRLPILDIVPNMFFTTAKWQYHTWLDST